MKVIRPLALLLLAIFFVLLLRWEGRHHTDHEPSVQSAESAATPTDAGSHPLWSETVERTAMLTEQEESDASDPQRELIGIVVATDGTPIASAVIGAMLQLNRQHPGITDQHFKEYREKLVAETRSAMDGRFRLRLELFLIYDVVACKPGYARTLDWNHYAGEELRIVLPRSSSIFGIVADAVDGTPIPGVSIRLKQGFVLGPSLSAETDADGQYRFDDLPTGECALDFQAPAHVRRYGIQVQIGEGEQIRQDVSMERGTTIHGRVTDGATGTVIEGAEIGMRAAAHRVHTDAEGRYRLAGVPHEFRDSLRIRAAGYGEFDFPINRVPPEGLEQDIGLLRGRTAHARVVDPNGIPVADATIVAEAHSSSQPYGSWQMDRQTAKSEADGRFTLHDLRVDLRHTLLIAADGHANMIYDFPESEWSALELQLGDLVLEPESVIAGTVVDPQGIPLPEIWVSLSGECWRRDALGPSSNSEEGYMSNAGLGFGDIYSRTDSRGRFAFTKLAAGSYHLWAGKKGIATATDLDLELLYEGESVTDLALVLDLGFTISGFVTDPDGSPVSSATIGVALETNPQQRITYAIADPQGAFVLAGLAAGSYVLSADAGFHQSNAAGWTGIRFDRIELSGVAAGASDLRLSLPLAVPVSGKVLGPLDEALADAVLMFTMDGESQGRGVANSRGDGSFIFWLRNGASGTLRVYPPMMFYPGKPVDQSFEVILTDVRAGDSKLVVKLPKLFE